MRFSKLWLKNLILVALATVSASFFLRPTHGYARLISRGHYHQRFSKIYGAVDHNRKNFQRYYSAARVIQCVEFAKSESEVVLSGNARDWWYNAAGRYARGAAPEVGSVLNFRPIRRMPLGHVAIVTGTLNSRVIIIDQSHWGQSGISRNVRVVDVSPDNNWSAVRVELNGRSNTFGSIYPTYGFIYPRQNDVSRVMAARATGGSADVPAPQYAEAAGTTGDVENQYLFHDASIRHRTGNHRKHK
ncbi:CHAP domain-containing protein [Acetobacter fallax]|uniref:CHAP domain-containing protein n=1 Tax=Acetobacter fallax TaxID=1737473 RepID=A0ABX0KF00_9PROT|nr:CHAP domain-containing protein [Acetobacter fallax]NHO34167.1 CHAP domain-containing protein [Acetobacter fallax]NHO37729.1 CHAP domain-containing protein [Acetobacter fallax]